MKTMVDKAHTEVGLGNRDYSIAIYIANRPPFPPYSELQDLQALAAGELAHIVKNCSNHWRKVFNIAAKIMFVLDAAIAAQMSEERKLVFDSWQSYRDKKLLQPGCREALLFSVPTFSLSDFSCITNSVAINSRAKRVHIVVGKTYAASLNFPFPLTWIDKFFAINIDNHLIVCPYFDYRQLSNARIEQLLVLARQFFTGKLQNHLNVLIKE